jgi:ABC-type antimicrobial peptide transport system permease subunit
MDMNFVNQQAAPGSSSQGFSFIINDRVLKSATASVENYISFTNALYPVIYLLCAGIGFIVSYLLIRTRKPEFAIMRSLGASRAASFFTFHIEQGLLCLLGAALGLVSSTLFTGQYSLESGFGYVSFYLVGSGVAIMAMNRVNVIEILTARE